MALMQIRGIATLFGMDGKDFFTTAEARDEELSKRNSGEALQKLDLPRFMPTDVPAITTEDGRHFLLDSEVQVAE